MKKVFLFSVLCLFVFAATSFSQESRHLLKENALSFKLGGHYYNNNVDLFDEWDVDESDMNDMVVEFAYEKNLTSVLSLEFSLGYFDSDETYNNIVIPGDMVKIDVLNLYLSPTLKGRFHTNDRFIFYLGVGPDVYYTNSDLKIDAVAIKFSEEDNFVSFGAHGLVGMEMYIMKNPVAFDFYDVPLSLVFEYKYAWVNEIKNADRKIINRINDELLTSFSKSDLDVGGHKFFIGLKWHY